MDRISELSNDILQRILSLLSQEDAVRTSVLSKSWRDIWCTRPNLDLSDTNFKHEFLSTVDKTLQRYSDQKICLEKFQLSMSLYYSHSELKSVWFLEKWIRALTNMGVKEFRLSIYSKDSRRRRRRVKLPSVVFEAEFLEDLHVEGFMFDRTTIERNILSNHLKKLHLEKVHIEDRIFQKIISSCPLIETMILKSCKRLINIKANNLRHLKHFTFSSSCHDEECSIEIYPPSLETIRITRGIILFQKGAEFCNLSSLSLREVLISSCSSCRFPSLTNLDIFYCDGLEESIEESQLFIDAPNIDSFVYHGFDIPSISFSTTSREWSSTLRFLFRDDPSLWLLKLRKLLESLSRSEISLGISQHYINAEDIFKENHDLVQDIKDENKAAVVVEELKLQGDLSYFLPVSNGLFSICRPRKIGNVSYTDAESVLKNLMQREGGNQDELRQLWLPDLEEVSLEIYDRNRREWDPTSLSDLPEYEEGKHISTRIALKWRQN
ncbi:PREDICTED: F-box/FBD/LRR-repeat protein At5g22660-like [Erythranthe guttata]|uniref:F-box/FBD/LRR-repeat protein At5g22660-like n=1 Tax=Erythranthe guttata TaxID=4155 RepID=UPI00064DF17B|nr:PREDICTED: F-box/FBD/LRR-repeat protein At5g22660-like [Erythranthe guttata]|eukprot:XP_012845993.1 PREDICTED: F-box/FBD/LRR-repeat protein At5g22660-like [Erythranthe guttata]